MIRLYLIFRNLGLPLYSGIAGGFVPNPLHEVNEYVSTAPEVGITIGALVLTVLYKIVVGVKQEIRA